MKILSTQYTMSFKSLDIYTAGCKPPHCKGCHNPETWSFDQGDIWDKDYFIKVKTKVEDFDLLIDRIMIFGGEPLDNDVEEVVKFLKDLSTLNLSVWLFTHYLIDEIPNEIKDLCDYIKTGRYLEEKKVDDYIQYGITLATSNQKIYKKGVDY